MNTNSRLGSYLQECIEVLAASIAVFDLVIEGYRGMKFRRYAHRLRDQGIDFVDLRIGVRSRRPAAIVQQAAYLLDQKEHRYYVETAVGEAATYRQEVGPTFYSFPDKPTASLGDRMRAEEGERRARAIRDEFEQILDEIGFEVNTLTA